MRTRNEKKKTREMKRKERKRERNYLRHLNFFVEDSSKWGEIVQGRLAVLQLHVFPQKKNEEPGKC